MNADTDIVSFTCSNLILMFFQYIHIFYIISKHIHKQNPDWSMLWEQCSVAKSENPLAGVE